MNWLTFIQGFAIGVLVLAGAELLGLIVYWLWCMEDWRRFGSQ